MSGTIIKQIKKHDIISFDIFDTLLLRPFKKPQDLFLYIEQITGKRGFFDARTSAESVFYDQNGTAKEATLNDIYSVIPDFKELKQVELDLELSGLVVNPEMKAVYDEAIKQNKKVIIVSDMYLPADFIKKVLHKNKITKYHKLYVSNEVQHRKDRGDMYKYVIDDLSVAPNKILHIGDNKNSDYKKALEYNIHSVLYRRQLETDKRYEKFYRHNIYMLSASVITALVGQHKRTGDYWRDFGYRYAGPVAFAYASFIYKKAMENKLKNVLFVARDGYLIEKVFNVINTAKIKTSYIYAPRILNYTANLDFDPKLSEQARIICEYFGVDTGNKTPNQYIEENRALFEKMARAEKTKTGYAKYIKSLVGKDQQVGVVDTISGQLSAQKLVEKESGVKTLGFYVATLPGRDILKQLSHNDFLNNEERIKFLDSRTPDLIELIFSAPENPIITLKDGKPVHQQVKSKWEDIRHEVYKKIETGVLEFAQDLTNRLGNELDIAPETIFNLLNVYVYKPTQTDIKEMFRVKRSPYADNSLYVPIFSAPYHIWQLGKLKKLSWLTTAQKTALCLFSPIKIKMRGLKSLKVIVFPRIRKNVFQISLFNSFGFYIGNDEK